MEKKEGEGVSDQMGRREGCLWKKGVWVGKGAHEKEGAQEGKRLQEGRRADGVFGDGGSCKERGCRLDVGVRTIRWRGRGRRR